ncbi:hypothetical protein [Absidia glauca]|uniref:histone acetyltransferase n=1 Tax=Absidia glauca TaxID=4829 RepID=A0A168Q315_ABSGL|nr:hypothetical protein [Absidia glauca]
MGDFFKQELQQRLSTLSTQQHYFVYDLSKSAETCTSMLPSGMKEPGQSIQLIHRLILVTTAAKHDDGGEEQRLVSGLEVYEYLTNESTHLPSRTIYISKIDTTGTTMGRGVTRRLVQAYVASQKHHLQQPSDTCRIHVFARAQPQYLFPHSAKDGSKRVLDDRQLVGWWHATLGSGDLYDKVKPYWIVPGVDEQEARLDTGVHQRGLWHYGSPYPASALATDVIPRFEDDGKARYLSSSSSDSITVEDFWTLFGYSEECGAGKLTAVFIVDSHRTTGPGDVPHLPPSLEDDQYTRLWNYLMDLDFCDDQANLKSTTKLLRKWKPVLASRCFKTTTVGNNKRTVDQALATETPIVNVLVPKRRKKAD